MVRAAASLIPLALFMAGCSGTVQTRSANADDTYFHWKPQMETLPIEVQGGVAQFGYDDIAKWIPYGTTPRQYAAATNGRGKLAEVPRIVLYVGEQYGVDAKYCATSPLPQLAAATNADTPVVAVLCDGPRAVVVTTRSVQSSRIQSGGMASMMKSIKRRLLFGLKADDQTVPAEYGNG